MEGDDSVDQGTIDYQCFLSGEEEGLSRIIRDHKDGLMLYINNFVQNIAVAEELTEETFVKLVMKRPRFLSKCSFRTWLYSIGRNTALSYLRCQKAAVIPLDACCELADQAMDLEQRYMQKDSSYTIHCVMKKLKPEYRQILWLCYFEDFSHKEIAQILGKSVHNVEVLICRARQALKVKLLEEGFCYDEL